jgi:hypothetical protein
MMKKVFLPLILLMLFAAGCNLHVSQPPTATLDIIATQIASLQTQDVQPTPAVTASLQNPTATTAATNTSQPTPTSPPTATATISPEDPRIQLGTPTRTDTLDNGKSFGLDAKPYDDDYTYIRIENGAMILTSRYATGYHGWRTGGTKLGNAYLEAKINAGECSGADDYGLVFRSPDFIKGYWFHVTCSGNWDLGYWDGSDYTSIKSGTNSSGALLTGSNQTNRLGVWTSGSQIKLYINGKLIGQAEDTNQTEPGSFGAMIAAFNTPNFTISIDEFSYWNLD